MSAMIEDKQQTLRHTVQCAGVGLHTGQRVVLRLRPAPANTGITFLRTDVPGPNATCLIRANWRQINATPLATVIGNSYGLSVTTVEHLLAALSGCGVDNVRIELDGPEVPILDGSSAPLVALVQQAGITSLPAPRRYIQVLKTVEVQDGDKWASYAPDQVRRFSVGIDFASRVIGQQHYSMVLQGDAFSREIASARTFGFREQIDALREQGLTLGGSLDNAILIDGDRIMNPQGLRYPDEFVRHKLLDSIGDLYLAGAPILGHYRAYKPGHGMNAALLRAMLSDTSAWRMVTSAESIAQSASRADSERLQETG